jgi:hypothetical protein
MTEPVPVALWVVLPFLQMVAVRPRPLVDLFL